MNKYLKQSIILHVAVFITMIIDMPSLWRHDMTLGEAPIIVDLSEVRIDEMTNLPSKAEFGPEDRKATVEEKPNQEQYTPKEEPKPEPEPVKEETKEPETAPETAVDEQPTEVKQDFLEAPVPEKKPQPKPDSKPVPKAPVPSSKPQPKPKPKTEPKPEPKKPQPQKETATQRSNALKSLMQEIDNSRDIDIGEKTQSAMIKEGTQVRNMGIEGGSSKGSYFSDLTISETDAIASLLRQNWNLDPGAIGIDGMVVEIRVFLARDGSIQKIEFVDTGRFNSDASYRSVAESAQRAVIATQQAFKEVFGVKYADRYDTWSTLRLYFDPMNKGVR
jgi:hypothetical protein